jgi:hypothetical protein
LICRRGNDSLIALNHLLKLNNEDDNYEIKDVIGGLINWADQIDKEFPIY